MAVPMGDVNTSPESSQLPPAARRSSSWKAEQFYNDIHDEWAWNSPYVGAASAARTSTRSVGSSWSCSDRRWYRGSSSAPNDFGEGATGAGPSRSYVNSIRNVASRFLSIPSSSIAGRSRRLTTDRTRTFARQERQFVHAPGSPESLLGASRRKVLQQFLRSLVQPLQVLLLLLARLNHALGGAYPRELLCSRVCTSQARTSRR